MEREIFIRAATVDDIESITRLRCLMFESMGLDDPKELAAVASDCEVYFGRAIPAGQYHGWLAVTPAGTAVASVGVVVDKHPPGPGNPSGRIGYIMNLCTEPAYRRRGLARQLFEQVMDWIRRQGITVAALHASDMGRPLYDRLGFSQSNEMRAAL
jgi:GNAT superfamily N-acetyltransferase